MRPKILNLFGTAREKNRLEEFGKGGWRFTNSIENVLQLLDENDIMII